MRVSIFQKSNFCGRPGDQAPREGLELLYSCIMGWVHIFCFLNHNESPAKRRMLFFYLVTLIENAGFITWWYFAVSCKIQNYN